MSAENGKKEIEDLRTLLDVSRQLGATIELPELLGSIVQAAIRVLSCERATVFLYDREANELYSVVAEGTQEIRFSADQGIAGDAARTGQIINVPDAYADPRFNQEIDKKLGFRTRNLLTFPLSDFDGTLVGVLQALNKKPESVSFSDYDENLASTLSAQAGVAIQRQMLLEAYAVKQKQDRDLELARKIQQELLPKSDPSVDGFDIAGWNRPADETGGDSYDFHALSDDRLLLTLADAVGHGIGAALIIAQCRSLLRAVVSTTSHDLPATVAQVNELLYQDLLPEQFVTSFVGILDPASAQLTYVSAGQGPLLVYRAAEKNALELPATSLPIAIAPAVPFEAGEPIAFAPGDMLVLVTDGFFEWSRPGDKGDQFGTKRLIEVIRENDQLPAAEIIQRLYSAVHTFAEGSVQDDDLTAIIVKRL